MWRRISSRDREFLCAMSADDDASAVRALIERILNLGDEVEDIEIVPPGLDAVYARFGGSGASERERAP